MESHSFTDRRRREFCRVVFAEDWRVWQKDDYVDTNNVDDVSASGFSDLLQVQGLGAIPRSVIKEVQIVEKVTTVVTTETFEVVDTMSFTC